MLHTQKINDNLEKIRFDAIQLQVFLLLANFKLDGMTSHKHDLSAKYSSKLVAPEVASFEKNFFRIAEAETLVKEKTKMFTCYRRRQKSKLFGVTLKKNPLTSDAGF